MGEQQIDLATLDDATLKLIGYDLHERMLAIQIEAQRTAANLDAIRAEIARRAQQTEPELALAEEG